MNITTKCPHCGAQISFYHDVEVLQCKFCDSIIAVPENVNQSSDASEEVELREVVPDLTFKANHVFSMTDSQGGNIWITKHELYFKPHALNIGDLSKRYIRIQDIRGYKKGGFNILTIYTRKKYAFHLTVWDKDAIMEALEARRIIYYKERGMPVPELITDENDELIKTADGLSGFNPSSKGNKIKMWICVILFILMALGALF